MHLLEYAQCIVNIWQACERVSPPSRCGCRLYSCRAWLGSGLRPVSNGETKHAMCPIGCAQTAGRKHIMQQRFRRNVHSYESSSKARHIVCAAVAL